MDKKEKEKINLKNVKYEKISRRYYYQYSSNLLKDHCANHHHMQHN